VPQNAEPFEWILTDELIMNADWNSERTERRGFLTCIETYCNENDLLAIRLSFNVGTPETFQTDFFGCIIDNQTSGDRTLMDPQLKELQVKYVKKRVMQIKRRLTFNKNDHQNFRTTNMVCNDDPENFRFGKEQHLYGGLNEDELYLDQLELADHIIGVFGYLLDVG
jgi:hypothetical protein